MAARCMVASVVVLLFAQRVLSCWGPKCYEQSGPHGLTLSFQLMEECKRDFSFVANVLDSIIHTHDCAGVLIDQETVIVPASCLQKRSHIPSSFPVVRLGSFIISPQNKEQDGEVFKVCKKVIHKGFNGNPHDGSDIALLVLNRPAEMYKRLADDKADFIREGCDDSLLSMVGWFASRPDGPPSLRLEMLRGLNNKEEGECAKIFESWPRNVICAASTPNANIAWDGGSPLLCDDKFVLGIASFTGRKGTFRPYVYTRLIEYRDWIDKRGDGNSVVEWNTDEECGGHGEL